MRHSLYDALEVSSSASVNVIATALRAVVRRFWSVPRDASGDSEEAVRFAALAASILIDPIRRKDYDAALNPGVGAGPWRLPISSAGARDAAAEAAGAQSQSRSLSAGGGELSQISAEATLPKSLPGVDALAEPLPDGSAWASSRVWFGWVIAVLVLQVASTLFVPEWGRFSPLQAIAMACVAVLLSLAFAFWLSRPIEAMGPAAGLSRLGIIKWRREGSIFIGVPPPQHDTAWIFKLRLMELTRSAAGFITATSLWRRLAARAVDYALIAIILYGLIAFSDTAIDLVDPWLIVIRSLFVLPVLVALAAVPIEAFFLRVMRTTPGKWLMGLVIVAGVTRPADHSKPGVAQLAWARASRAALAGAALGVWPITIIRALKNWRDARDSEVDWDASGDSLVMARPMTAPTVATALLVLLAASLILVSGWRRDYIAFWPYAVTWIATADSRASGLLKPQTTDPAGVTLPTSTPPPAPVPEPAVASSVAVRVPTALPAASPSDAKETGSVKVPVSSSETSATEAQMSQQASAARARRIRIDGYERQAENAQRSGNYAGLQSSCKSWTTDQPGNSLAWRCLGLAQFQNGAGRDALPALRQSLKLGSKDPLVEDAILRILRP